MTKLRTRKLLLRLLVLLISGSIPVLALIWAFFSREPEYVCGSWWYGVLLPLVIGGLGMRAGTPDSPANEKAFNK